MCKQPQMTFAQGLGDLSYKTPRLCQFCHASAEISSTRLQFEICILQFPIFNVLFLQSTPFACCRKVMAANSFDWYGSGCKGFGCCANRS